MHWKLPAHPEARSIRRAKLERALADLCIGTWDARNERRWIMLALEYFHGVKRFSPEKVSGAKQVHEPAGILLTLEGQEYFVPVPVGYRGASPGGPGQIPIESADPIAAEKS